MSSLTSSIPLEQGRFQFFPPPMAAGLRLWMGRAVGLGLLAAVAFVSASLVTWSVEDPSLTYQGDRVQAVNALRGHGAILGDIFLQGLGLTSCIGLAAPLFWGLQLTFSQPIPGVKLKAVLFFWALALSAAALAALPVPASWPLHHGLGGALGDLGFDLGHRAFASLGLHGLGFYAPTIFTGLSSALCASWLVPWCCGFKPWTLSFGRNFWPARPMALGPKPAPRREPAFSVREPPNTAPSFPHNEWPEPSSSPLATMADIWDERVEDPGSRAMAMRFAPKTVRSHEATRGVDIRKVATAAARRPIASPSPFSMDHPADATVSPRLDRVLFAAAPHKISPHKISPHSGAWRDIVRSHAFAPAHLSLPIALGVGDDDQPIVPDLARLPHLLVTGSDPQEVAHALHILVLSLAHCHTPDTLRFVLISPRFATLDAYGGLPHLQAPLVTGCRNALAALASVSTEVDERMKQLAKLDERDIAAFNARVRDATSCNQPLERLIRTGFDPISGQALYTREETRLKTMPRIVVVVDEFSDLIGMGRQAFESLIDRISRKAARAGLHLVLATGQPKETILTATVKSCFSSRLTTRLASVEESYRVLGNSGAEYLPGQGHALFAPAANPIAPLRLATLSAEDIAIAHHGPVPRERADRERGYRL